MKITTLLAAALTFGSSLHAQFYAPDTEFHDRSQRVFPIEAARVLADRQNSAGAKIASIIYEVVTAPEIVWTVRWLDAAKKPLREKTVRYPEALLTEGPTYFREVFRQLAADDWAIALTPSDGPEAAFWQGSEGAGLSRLEAAAAAGRALATMPKAATPADAARLAGILAQGAVPSISTAHTIDGLLLARAAAWLAIAEARGGKKLDALWAPLLFLAGREPTASKLWLAQLPKPADPLPTNARLWDFLLRPHRAPDAFRFAAAPENKTVAMPLMAYASNMDEVWANLTVEVSGDLFGGEMLSRLHEYMVAFSTHAGVGGGHFASDAPGQFLTAWEDAMKAFTPSALEDPTWRAPFSAAERKRPKTDESATDALRRLAPVLNLGLDQHSAPLVPTSGVTAADLIGYGWEMAARQFGAHHYFLEEMLGDPDAAREVAAAALKNLRGCDVFFVDTKMKPKERLTDFLRLELTNAPLAHAKILEHLPPAWRQPPDHYLRRNWLAGAVECDGLEQLLHDHAPESVIDEFLRRLFAEGGPNASVPLITFQKRYTYPPAMDRYDLRARIVRALPWAIYPQVILAYQQSAKSGQWFDYARRVEEIGWQNLTAVYDSAIYFRYVEANAIPAANRFYDAIVPFVTDTVTFSNSTAPARFFVAWWENDDAAMRRARADGATYSARDLLTQTAYALHRDNLAAAEKLLDAIGERYGQSDTLSGLKAYLPLIPALKNPSHPEHRKAVTGFVPDGGWWSLQFMLARDAKLSNEEAVEFFDRPNASSLVQMVIAYFKRDKAAFQRSYLKEGLSSNGGPAVLSALMRHELFEIPPRNDVPDIKPAEARPLPSVLRELQGPR